MADFKSEISKLSTAMQMAMDDNEYDTAKLFEDEINQLKAQEKARIKAQMEAQPAIGIGATALNYGIGGGVTDPVGQAKETLAEEAQRQETIKRLQSTPEGRAQLAAAEREGTMGALGAGWMRGSQVIRKGLGFEPQEYSKDYQEAMGATYPTAYGLGKTANENVGLTSGGMGVSLAAAPLATLGGWGAIAAAGLELGSGAGQGYIMAKGEGRDPTIETVLGAAFNIFGAKAHIDKLVGAKVAAHYRLPTEKVVDEAGNPTPEFLAFAEQNGITEAQLKREAEDALQTVQKFGSELPREDFDLGKTPQQIIDDFAAVLNPHQGTVELFKKNGIDISALPIAVYAQNEKMHELGRLMNQMIGSQERSKLMTTAGKVNELTEQAIHDFHGNTSAADFSHSTVESMKAMRATLKEQESEAWGRLRPKLNEATEEGAVVEPPAGLAELQAEARRVIGFGDLTEKQIKERSKDLLDEERRVLGLWKNGEKPTYDRVDRLRSEVWEAHEKASAEGKKYILNNLYHMLDEARTKFARDVLDDDQLTAAKLLTQKKNEINDQVLFFTGREENKSMVTALTETGKQIKNEDFAVMERVFNNIPQDKRQGAMASLLGKIANVRPKIEGMPQTNLGSNMGAFSTSFDNIHKSDKLRGLVKTNLGEEGYETFHNLAKMHKNLSRAASAPSTGIIGESNKTFVAERATLNLINSLSTAVKKIPTIVTKTAGNLGEGVAETLKKKEGQTKVVKSIEILANSPRFTEAVTAAAANPASTEAKRKSIEFMNTRAAQEYLKTVDTLTARKVLAAGGLPLYLTIDPLKLQQQDEQQQQAGAPNNGL